MAINSIQNDGIISHAQNAAGTYNQAVKDEQSMLQEYEDYLTGINGGFEAYEVGDEVIIGTEQFFVIKYSSNKESKVTLLAKKCINTGTLLQEAADGVVFSSTNYWADENEEYEVDAKYERKELGENVYYDLTETSQPDESHYALRAAWDYAKKIDENAIGRLLTYPEAVALQSSHYDIVDYTNSYWFGSAVNCADVWYWDRNYEIQNNYDCIYDSYKRYTWGVRPVIEISKSKVTLVTE